MNKNGKNSLITISDYKKNDKAQDNTNKKNNTYNPSNLSNITSSNGLNKNPYNKPKINNIQNNNNKKTASNIYTYELNKPLLNPKDIFSRYDNKTANQKNIINNNNTKMNVPPEYQILYDKLNKNTGISTQKELDPYQKFQRYFEEHRFLTNENIYQNYQKYLTKKTNKIHKSGIICDVGYTLLEIFQCGNFNMSRLKPIDFSDMKLDIKVKYKQMSPDEKAVYLEKIKDLKIRQKKEKIIRIDKYLEDGTNILFIKFTNESNYKDKKKAYEIDTLFNMKEIEAAKSCIKNNYCFPPENYFESTFIPKLTKDEETGEINFWTKNFYHKLLKNYFKTEEEIKRKMYEEEKKQYVVPLTT